MTVNNFRTLVVNIFGVVGDSCAANLAYDFENLVVGVHGILEVKRCIVVFFCVSEVAFFERNDFLHQGMSQVMLQIGIVCIKVSHG